MSRLSIFSSKAEAYLANAILIGLACFFGLWLVKFIFLPSPLINFLGYFFLTVCAIFPLVALKFSAMWRKKFSMTLLGFVLALYCFEYCLKKIEEQKDKVLLKENRSINEVFDGISANDKKHSIPVGTLTLLSLMNGNVYGGIKISNGEILPLSNLSHAPTYLCNNSNGPIIFNSDRYGFNNEDHIWSSKICSVAILGDSYVEGVCVKPEKNILSEIIKEFPASLNLGIVGQGPLTMLGIIKEYLVYKQPKTVIWCYSNNDIYPNLAMEKENRVLKKYLEVDFSQNLINQQTEVDKIMNQFLQSRINKPQHNSKGETLKEASQPPAFQIFNVKTFKLYRLRQKIFRSVLTKINSDYNFFEEVINSAKKTVDTWSGRIIFVYLPGPDRFYKNQVDPAKEKILEIISRNGIEIVDMEAEMIKVANPKVFFVNSHSHYNEKGYQFVSKEILNKIVNSR